MRRDYKNILQGICTIICVSGLAAADVDATDFDPKEYREPMYSERPRHLANEGGWYFYASGLTSYYNLGKDFDRAIGEIENLFAGKNIQLPLLSLETNFQMQSHERVERAPTFFIPTGNLAFGIIRGRHKFEMDTALAGVVPLNTINSNTTMQLTEYRVCTDAELDSCPMAKLGFVDQTTGTGHYSLKINMNENIWLISPSLSYSYEYRKLSYGTIAFGGAAGVVFLSARQQLTFSATRIDIKPSDSTPLQHYQSRTIEGIAQSTAVSDLGPIFRLFVEWKPLEVKGYQTLIRVGGSYGFVYLHRDVDGSGTVILGDTLAASFPTTSLGFSGKDTTRFEMAGAFIQIGLIL